MNRGDEEKKGYNRDVLYKTVIKKKCSAIYNQSSVSSANLVK
jgi:hypothetical protein